MNITVVGTGYVGLVTGVCLAEFGHNVLCVDSDKQKVARMKRGETPIFEADLATFMKRNIAAGRLSFTTSLSAGTKHAEAIFLALPTPPQADGAADLSIIKQVALDLSTRMPRHFCVVINKSTVPVGTAETVRKIIAQHTSTSQFDVVSNPEFLREGHAVADFMNPERIVVGVTSKQSERVMRDIYAASIQDERLFLVTDPRTAELVKYASNTFLVAKISFMNEISQLCERMGANVDMVRKAMGSDSRIGNKFLNAGIGAGGSCFPKDVRALKKMSEDYNYDFKILKASMAVNHQQHHHLLSKIKEHFKDDIAGKTFALWGVAFKPDTDDIREAPALTLVNGLVEHGAKVVAYDPEAGDNADRHFRENDAVIIVKDKYEALKDAAGLLIATEWSEFINADLKQVKEALTHSVIFDGRNIFEPATARDAGLNYYSIGRQPALSDDQA